MDFAYTKQYYYTDHVYFWYKEIFFDDVTLSEITNTNTLLLDSNYIIDSNTSVALIKDTILVSVLLPLYVEGNDKQVKLWQEKNQDTNRVHPSSKLALDFLDKNRKRLCSLICACCYKVD